MLSQFVLSRIDIQTTNQHNLDALKNGGIVTFLPHNSHIDTVITQALFYKHFQEEQLAQDPTEQKAKEMLEKLYFLAGADYWGSFILSAIAHLAVELSMIHRKNKRKAFDDLDKTGHRIQRGGIATLYPEETRSRNPFREIADRELKPGFAQLASLVGPNFPIIPILVQSNITGEIWPVGQKMPNFDAQTVTILVGEPITSTALTTGKLDLLAQSQLYDNKNQPILSPIQNKLVRDYKNDVLRQTHSWYLLNQQ